MTRRSLFSDQIRTRLECFIDIRASSPDNDKVMDALVSYNDNDAAAAFAPFFCSPCELGASALLVLIQTTSGTRFSVAGVCKNPVCVRSLSMIENKGMVEVSHGPVTRDSARILRGWSPLLCSLLSWDDFPDDLTIQIRDDGSIHAIEEDGGVQIADLRTAWDTDNHAYRQGPHIIRYRYSQMGL